MIVNLIDYPREGAAPPADSKIRNDAMKAESQCLKITRLVAAD